MTRVTAEPLPIPPICWAHEREARAAGRPMDPVPGCPDCEAAQIVSQAAEPAHHGVQVPADPPTDRLAHPADPPTHGLEHPAELPTHGLEVPAGPAPGRAQVPADRLARVQAALADPVAAEADRQYTRLTAVARAKRRIAAEAAGPVQFRPASDLDGQTPMPGLFYRTDGTGLLYPADLNWLFAPPGFAKTWFAYAAALDVARHGQRVMVLDYELSPSTFRARMDELGASPAELGRIVYAEYPVFTDAEAFREHLAEHSPALVVIDSAEPLLDIYGLDGKDPASISALNRTLFLPARQHGAATLILDHPPKSSDSKRQSDPDAMQPWNSGAKQGIASVIYRLGDSETDRPERGKRVEIPLYIPVKDRHGKIETTRNDPHPPVAGSFVVDGTGHLRAYVKPDLFTDLVTEAAEAFARKLRFYTGPARTYRAWLTSTGGTLTGTKAKRTAVLDKARELRLVTERDGYVELS